MSSYRRHDLRYDESAEEALARARLLEAEDQAWDGFVAARQALALRELEVGERHGSLVDYLRTCGALAFRCQGWDEARPYYERARRLGSSPRSLRPSSSPLRPGPR